MKPYCTQLDEVWMQRDALGANEIDEATDGCECVAGTDSDEHVISFTGVHVGLGGFNECPGQLGFLYVLHCSSGVFAGSQRR
jgi:hypothetical protein